MFPKKISQNIDIFARIHGNVFPWQPAIIGNKASFYLSIFQISIPWLHLTFFNACPRYLKSRRNLLYTIRNSRHFRVWFWRCLFFLWPIALVTCYNKSCGKHEKSYVMIVICGLKHMIDISKFDKTNCPRLNKLSALISNVE